MIQTFTNLYTLAVTAIDGNHLFINYTYGRRRGGGRAGGQ
jgi:hypothetical protein